MIKNYSKPGIWSGAANKDMNNYIKNTLNEIESGEFNSIQELKKSVDDLIELIDNMPKSKCLQEDTLLFRGILPDERMSEKDILSFFEGAIEKENRLKTFTSSTFDVEISNQFAEYDYGEGYIIKIHAPKGTKGVAINEDMSSAYEEYEYLLSPNQKFKTMNIDVENKIIDIILV